LATPRDDSEKTLREGGYRQSKLLEMFLGGVPARTAGKLA